VIHLPEKASIDPGYAIGDGTWCEVSLCKDARFEAPAAIRVGPPTELEQADDPGRAIEIVALTGQLCAAGQLTPDRDRTRYSKSVYLVPTFRSSWKRVLRWSTNFGKWALGAVQLRSLAARRGRIRLVGISPAKLRLFGFDGSKTGRRKPLKKERKAQRRASGIWSLGGVGLVTEAPEMPPVDC
jgi:hypothetical protein